MERKRLAKFIKWFARQKTVFDLGDPRLCVAGEALRFLGHDPVSVNIWSLVTVFDLTQRQAHDIFMLWIDCNLPPRYSHSRPYALAMLRGLMRTGRVDWPTAAAKVFS